MTEPNPTPQCAFDLPVRGSAANHTVSRVAVALHSLPMYFTVTHEELRLHIRTFLEKEVQPHLEEWEEKTFPDSIFQRLGELGFLGLRYPPEYGCQGGDYFSAVVLSEELARVGSGGLGMAVAVQTEMATHPVFQL